MTHHSMPATSCVVLLIIALVIDLLSVGPGSIRDRVAFGIAIPALYAGWAGEPLANWFNAQLASLTGMGLKSSGSNYIAAASPTIIVSAFVAGAFIYAVGCVLPRRAQRWVGRIATYDLARGKGKARSRGGASAPGGAVSITKVKPGRSEGVTPGGGMGDAAPGQRLNMKLWGLALFLALTADLPRGAVGQAISATIGALISTTSGLPNLLIGAVQ